MAQFVELSGTAGSGKTTLYKELSKSWRKTDSWVPAHYLLPRRSADRNPIKNLLKHLRDKVCGQPGNLDHVQMIEAGERFIQQNPELLSLFWENIYQKQKGSLNGIDQRFDKAGFLFSLIQKQQIITEHPARQLAIVDEGPSKIIDVLSNTMVAWHLDKDEIEACLRFLKLPKAVIYFETDVDTTINRILGRRHMIRAHKNMDRKQMENFVVESHHRKKFVNACLKEKGIEILYLDALMSASANAVKAVDFINAIALHHN
jgi:thymidylate kinase